jgi:hypothetical protein
MGVPTKTDVISFWEVGADGCHGTRVQNMSLYAPETVPNCCKNSVLQGRQAAPRAERRRQDVERSLPAGPWLIRQRDYSGRAEPAHRGAEVLIDSDQQEDFELRPNPALLSARTHSAF